MLQSVIKPVHQQLRFFARIQVIVVAVFCASETWAKNDPAEKSLTVVQKRSTMAHRHHVQNVPARKIAKKNSATRAHRKIEFNQLPQKEQKNLAIYLELHRNAPRAQRLLDLPMDPVVQMRLLKSVCSNPEKVDALVEQSYEAAFPIAGLLLMENAGRALLGRELSLIPEGQRLSHWYEIMLQIELAKCLNGGRCALVEDYIIRMVKEFFGKSRLFTADFNLDKKFELKVFINDLFQADTRVEDVFGSTLLRDFEAATREISRMAGVGLIRAIVLNVVQLHILRMEDSADSLLGTTRQDAIETLITNLDQVNEELEKVIFEMIHDFSGDDFDEVEIAEFVRAFAQKMDQQ